MIKSLDKQECAYCSKVYQPNSPKHIYCSNNCRVAYHRTKEQASQQQQREATKSLAAELDEIKTAPVTRKEVVQEVNPAWQQQQQRVERQQKVYDELTDELDHIQQKIYASTDQRKGAYMGAAIGIALVLVLMAMRYDTRKTKPLGATYAVLSLLGLGVLGLIGYHIGAFVSQQSVSDDEQVAVEVAELDSKCQTLEERCTAEKETLHKLEAELSQIPKFLRETIVTTDQVRQPATEVA